MGKVLPKVRVCVSSPRLSTRDGTFRFCRLILSSSWSCPDVSRTAIGWHVRIILGLVQSEETFPGGSEQWLKEEITCFQIQNTFTLSVNTAGSKNLTEGLADLSKFFGSKSLTCYINFLLKHSTDFYRKWKRYAQKTTLTKFFFWSIYWALKGDIYREN